MRVVWDKVGRPIGRRRARGDSETRWEGDEDGGGSKVDGVACCGPFRPFIARAEMHQPLSKVEESGRISSQRWNACGRRIYSRLGGVRHRRRHTIGLFAGQPVGVGPYRSLYIRTHISTDILHR